MTTSFLKTRLGGHLLEGRAALRAIPHRLKNNPRPGKLFVLFGRGRSGSTLLVKMLDAHPDVTCLNEILRYKTFAPTAYFDNVLAPVDTACAGFKLLSYQVRRYNSQRKRNNIREWLTSKEVTIFHLKRRNLFNHAISNIYARRRAVFHSTDQNAGQHATVHIEPGELMAWMSGSETLLAFEDDFLAGLETREIVYERDLEDAAKQTTTFHRLREALSLKDVDVDIDVSLKKVTPPNYRRLISNFAEIEAALRGTGFERYLPDRQPS